MADGAEKKKRKRDADAEARITYHTPLKSFERLFNESSLEETKHIVRTKLKLDDNADITLSQIRGNKVIVLEDEDDFKAFRFMLKTNPWVELQVSVTESTGPNDAASPIPKKRKKSKAEKRKQHLETANALDSKADATHGANESTTSTSTLVDSLKSPTVSKEVNESTPIVLTPTVQPAKAVVAPAPPKSKKTKQKTSPGTPTLHNTEIGVVNPPTTLSAKRKPEVESNARQEEAPQEQNHSARSESEPRQNPKEDLPKTKATKRKSAPVSVTPMSPASREKASLILQRHRANIAEREKIKKKGSKANVTVNGPEGLAEVIDAASVANTHPPLDDKVIKRKSKTKEPERQIHAGERAEAHTPSEEHHDSTDADTKLLGSSTRRPVVIITKYVPPMANTTNPAVDPDMSLDPAKPKRPKKGLDVPLCPICDGTFHDRQDCPVFQEAGDALQARLKQFKKAKQKELVRDIERHIENETRLKRLGPKSRKSMLPIPPPPPHPLSSDNERTGIAESSDSEDGQSNQSVPPSLAGPVRSPSQTLAQNVLPISSLDDEINDNEGTPRVDMSPVPPPTSPSVASSILRGARKVAQPAVSPSPAPSRPGESSGKTQPLGNYKTSSSRSANRRANDLADGPQPTQNPRLLAIDSSASENDDSNDEQAPASATAIDLPEIHMDTNGMDIDDKELGSDDEMELPVPERSEVTVQATPRSTFLPRLSQMSISGVRLASTLWRGSSSTPLAAKAQPISVPPTQTKEKVEMAYTSSSSSSSSDEEFDSRIPASQRASSRVRPAATKRKSALSQL
ncbi:hypothetical protein PIIN_02156 [Serendipita indica DSM 11827]|uniref:Uncharacterized protein n=1 Tax=Serendipita indica (strain DSM 11827) TaxID=1109443 RepID=G4TAF3_SERID|nr:hypothetical protein PIIN_02156 [Serendipita indica DSM 11827]